MVGSYKDQSKNKVDTGFDEDVEKLNTKYRYVADCYALKMGKYTVRTQYNTAVSTCKAQ